MESQQEKEYKGWKDFYLPSQAAAAAVTEEVSLIAVPANSPKPSLESPGVESRKKQGGYDVEKKMTDMDWATSLSSANNRSCCCNGRASADG